MSQDMALALPFRMDGYDMRVFAQTFRSQCHDGLPRSVLIDFKALGFIEPVGVTFLSNFCHWMHYQGIKPYFFNHDAATQPLRFLDDSLFFAQHLGEKINPAASPRTTTKHLQRVGHEGSHAWIRSELVPWLQGHTGRSASSFHAIQVCVSEIFNNIQDHTDIPNGSIFIQRFPRKDIINISIADFGVGIPFRVRSLRPELDDHQAILAAVKLGFTTRTTPRNRGAGLDYLLQTIVATIGGYVRIYSLGGYAAFYQRGDEVVGTTYPMSGFCPGTTIEIEIRTDRIPYVEETPEDLTW